MINTITRNLVFAAALAILTGTCPAQDRPEVSLRFLTVPKATERETISLLLGERKTLEIEVPSNALSEPYKVSAMDQWVFGKPGTGEDGKPSFKVYGKADSLRVPQQLVLLVRKGKSFEDGVDVVAVRDQAGVFSGGEFLFMNLARIDVAGIVGGKKFAIKPGKHSIVRPSPRANGRNFHTAFFYRSAEEEARSFFSSTWPHRDNVRSMVFFYHDPETRRLRFHAVEDYL